ncbi:MAG: sugar ABC transporter permease, partial [Planctomycetota bacterium]
DAFELQLAGEFDPASFAPVAASLEGLAYRDAVSVLTSIAGEGNAGQVRDIVREYATPVREGFTSGEGLAPPEWLISSRWAKTALIIMGVWLAIGGGNMLLYLAGLSNIPPELYEAAAIDGATGWQRFMHVTWPQLAPTTFFIVIMSTIGGLQGGFEQALVMTQGKADTIVITYYIYNLAFNGNFQLGLASAVAWIMFGMIFVMTAVNFRFGSRLTNE